MKSFFFENIDIWGFGSYELKSRYRKVSIMEIFGDFKRFDALYIHFWNDIKTVYRIIR